MTYRAYIVSKCRHIGPNAANRRPVFHRRLSRRVVCPPQQQQKPRNYDSTYERFASEHIICDNSNHVSRDMIRSGLPNRTTHQTHLDYSETHVWCQLWINRMQTISTRSDYSDSLYTF